MSINIYSGYELEKIKESGKLVAKALDYITSFVKPGVSTGKLNDLCHDYIVKNNAIPAALNYCGFPKSVCTSVNHEVCHGIPMNNKILKNGDILNIDIAVILDGYYGDSSRMYTVGECKPSSKRLIKITEETMWEGIKQVKPSNYTGDIGYAMEEYAKKNFCSTVYEYTGHGVGKDFHEDPSILNFGKPKSGELLVPGMIFTIEPMVNLGKRNVSKLSDGWTVVTSDRSLSAQFEHMVLVTDSGYEIFTLGELSNILDPDYKIN